MERWLAGPWQRMVDGKARMLERVGRWGAEEREWRPGAAAWSLADVVEHVVLAEAGLGFGLAKDPSPDKPRVVKPGRWVRWPVLRFVMLTGVRIRAPVDAVLPTRELGWEGLTVRWAAQRSDLEEWLERSDPRVHANPRFKHPIVGWLNVPQALTFGADHLAHHLQQAGRIERALERRGSVLSKN